MSSGDKGSPEPDPFDPSPAERKRIARRQARQRRDECGVDARRAWSRAASEHLIASGLLGSAQILAAYAAFRSEADPRVVVDWHVGRGRPVAFPRVFNDTLQWFIAPPDTLVPAPPWSIPEPVPGRHEVISSRDIDAWIVPGLAFTADGHRLGYGRGHYDRVLEESAGRIRIGFAFSVQVVRALPDEPHDQRMTAVATERGVVGDGR